MLNTALGKMTLLPLVKVNSLWADSPSWATQLAESYSHFSVLHAATRRVWHRLDEYPLDPRTQTIFIRLAEPYEQTRRVVHDPKKIALDSPSCMNNSPSPSITESTLNSLSPLSNSLDSLDTDQNEGLGNSRPNSPSRSSRLAELPPCN